MTSVVTAPEPPLGSEDNPHTYERGQKRNKGEYYLKKGILLRWNGSKLYNKVKAKEYRDDNKDRRKEYLKKNQLKIKKQKKEYHKKNREKRNLQTKEWRENNREKILIYNKNTRDKRNKKKREYYASKEGNEKHRIYRENNKNKINEYWRNRYRNDDIYKLTTNIRGRLNIALKSQNAYKNENTFEYYSCSVKYLYHYIELQFESWMTWNNWGVYDPNGPRTWQLDHRKPCDSFDLNDEEQVYMCCHWTNLQPLCSKENTVNKRDKFDPETFRYKWWGKEIGWLGIPKYLMPNTSKLL